MLTKDNLIKRGWQGNDSCIFCAEPETGDHLFVTCSFINSFGSGFHHIMVLFSMVKPYRICGILIRVCF